MMELVNKENLDGMYELMIKKDTSKLTQKEKLKYCASLCESLGLNPLTQPFEFIKLNGRETPYAKKDATDQLRKIHNVSIEVTSEGGTPGIYMVRAKATLPNGRTDMSTGAVNIQGVKGDALCNQLLKCETKAKRRVTLSICGLGFLDESEFDTLPLPRTGSRNDSPSEQSRPALPLKKLDNHPELIDEVKLMLRQLTKNFTDVKTLTGLYAYLKVKDFDEVKKLNESELKEVTGLLEAHIMKGEQQESDKFVEEQLEF